MKALADQYSRKAVCYWCLIGIALAVLKNLLVQQTAQWLNVPPDSLTYQLHGTAFAMNWQGLPVDAAANKLVGFINSWRSESGPIWMPGMEISFLGVFGTYEWIYSAFLGCWQFFGEGWEQWALLANAGMAGSFPAAAFLLAKHLGANFRFSHIGALLVSLDPSIAVNSSWMLKDTLAGFVTVIAVILLCRLYDRPSLKNALWFSLALGPLAGVRFVAFAAFAVVLIGLIQLHFFRKASIAGIYGIALLSSISIWTFIYFAPTLPTVQKVQYAITSPLQGQTNTLNAQPGQAGADKSVVEWRRHLDEDPASAIIRAIVRTSLAPYPWVAFTHGLSGTNYIELYLPGTALWILCLPALLVGAVATIRQRKTKAIILLILLSILASAYITYFGEWSTRQRVFMNPVFYAFIAIGWQKLLGYRGRNAPDGAKGTYVLPDLGRMK